MYPDWQLCHRHGWSGEHPDPELAAEKCCIIRNYKIKRGTKRL